MSNKEVKPEVTAITITKEQLAVIHAALSVTEDGRQKMFPESQQLQAHCLNKKLLEHTDDEGRQFTDGELVLSTTEKSFILELLKRQWPISQLEHVVNLRTILN